VASGDIMSVLNGEQPIELNNTDNFACLARIFANCKSLIDASQLIFSSKTLTNNCYRDSFINCENLKYPPILPATSLYDNCYRGMFAYCTSLLHAPILPAPILYPYCYQDMLTHCYNLNTINVGFSEWSPSNATTQWVSTITTNGTFICPTKLPIQYGASYIPSNWTIKQN
jgi:hypothetical protein